MGAKADRTRKSSENNGLAGEAYITVRERILRGELAIGQVISRRKVAAELGMSFLPVSEALLRLEHEGLLESRPRAGTRVRVPTRADVQGQYVVREALEAQAALLFSTLATRDERAELMRLAIRVDALSAQPEGSRFVYLTLHEKLHRRIAECARCTALSDAIGRAAAVASTWLCVTPVSLTGESPAHESLLKVLAADDPVAASEAMRRHIQSGMENALRCLDPFFQMQKANPQTYSRTPRKRAALGILRTQSAAI
ncbi:MAG TPA: GntR family transcriptional regulator [Bryobacteraceae bacterium]|jgi:DNA-binding GntR family transcriptional regulator|nr:GntR family transcriptional regulator [Bryobacteraceae bacterium]